MVACLAPWRRDCPAVSIYFTIDEEFVFLGDTLKARGVTSAIFGYVIEDERRRGVLPIPARRRRP